METVPESQGILKIREKAQEQIDRANKILTDSSKKQEAVESIYRSVAKNTQNEDWVCLKDKEMKVFDGNQNSAEPSTRIHDIAINLGIEINPVKA